MKKLNYIIIISLLLILYLDAYSSRTGYTVQTIKKGLNDVLIKQKLTYGSVYDSNISFGNKLNIRQLNIRQQEELINILNNNDYDPEILYFILAGVSAASDIKFISTLKNDRRVYMLSSHQQHLLESSIKKSAGREVVYPVKLTALAMKTLFSIDQIENISTWTENEKKGFIKMMNSFVSHYNQGKDVTSAFYIASLEHTSGYNVNSLNHEKTIIFLQRIIDYCGINIG